MRWIREHRIFIASPSGQEDVRRAFFEEVTDYNRVDGLRRGMTFTPVGWEATLPGPQRPQSLINLELKTCDAFVLVLQDRWGSRPDEKDGIYSSGCHEEFELAKECLRDPTKPLSDLIILFRNVDAQQKADPGPQLSRVLSFRDELARSKEHLFGEFNEVEDFRRRVRNHLAAWLHAIEKKNELDSCLAVPKPQRKPNQDLEEVIKLSEEGLLTEADQLFFRFLLRDQSPESLFKYGSYLKQEIRWKQAEEVFQQIGDYTSPEDILWRAKALYHQGELKVAKAIFFCFKFFSQMKKEYPSEPSDLQVAMLLGDLRETEEKIQQTFDEAQELLAEAADLYEGTGDPGISGVKVRSDLVTKIRGQWKTYLSQYPGLEYVLAMSKLFRSSSS